VELGRELARVRFRPFVPLEKLGPGSSEERRIQQYWGDVEVPYIPKYAFEELLACFSDTPHLKTTLLNSAEKVASLLLGRPIEMVPVTEDLRTDVVQQYARKPYIVAMAEEYALQLKTNDLDLLRRILLRLVQVAPTIGPSVQDIACICPLIDFSDPDETRLIVQAISRGLLVRAEVPDASPTLGLADARLIRGWKRLADWIDKDRDFLAWIPQLTQARKTWIGSGQMIEDLLTGTVLAEALRWLESRRAELHPEEIAFIKRSHANDEAIRRAAEAELKSPAVQRRLQKLQTQSDQEELLKRDKALLEARRDFSVRSKRWGLALAFTGSICLLAVGVSGYLLWHHFRHPAPTQAGVLSPSTPQASRGGWRNRARRRFPECQSQK
jgi:hypothetical protein